MDVRLKEGVFFTLVEDEGILLDLHADRYIALNARSALVWKHFAEGLPLDASFTPAEVSQQVDAWRACGLADAPAGPPTPRHKPPGAVATRAFDIGGARPSLVSAWRLAMAERWAARSLERFGLAHTIRDLQAFGGPARAPSSSNIARTARTLRWMRAPFRHGREDCLKRSLQLSHTLRINGHEPDLCFGVTRFPFRAHAWVEVDGRVVGDSVGRLSLFTMLARF